MRKAAMRRAAAHKTSSNEMASVGGDVTGHDRNDFGVDASVSGWSESLPWDYFRFARHSGGTIISYKPTCQNYSESAKFNRIRRGSEGSRRVICKAFDELGIS